MYALPLQREVNRQLKQRPQITQISHARRWERQEPWPQTEDNFRPRKGCYQVPATCQSTLQNQLDLDPTGSRLTGYVSQTACHLFNSETQRQTQGSLVPFVKSYLLGLLEPRLLPKISSNRSHTLR